MIPIWFSIELSLAIYLVLVPLSYVVGRTDPKEMKAESRAYIEQHLAKERRKHHQHHQHHHAQKSERPAAGGMRKQYNLACTTSVRETFYHQSSSAGEEDQEEEEEEEEGEETHANEPFDYIGEFNAVMMSMKAFNEGEGNTGAPSGALERGSGVDLSCATGDTVITLDQLSLPLPPPPPKRKAHKKGAVVQL